MVGKGAHDLFAMAAAVHCSPAVVEHYYTRSNFVPVCQYPVACQPMLDNEVGMLAKVDRDLRVQAIERRIFQVSHG